MTSRELRASALAGLAAALAAGVAHAQPVVSPFDSATNVPTNVVPFIDGHVDGSSVRLLDGSGAAVDASVVEVGESVERSGGSGARSFEIFPAIALEAETTYTLAATTRGPPLRSSFTTGMGPAEPSVPSTPAVVAQLTFTRPETGYRGRHACLLAEGAEFVDITVLPVVDPATAAPPGAYPELHFLREGPEHTLYGIADSDLCLEIRARSVTGERSAPVRVCDLPFYPASGWYPTCRDGRVRANDSWYADEGPPDGGDAAGAADAFGGGADAASSRDASDAARASDEPSRRGSGACSTTRPHGVPPGSGSTVAFLVALSTLGLGSRRRLGIRAPSADVTSSGRCRSFPGRPCSAR